MRDVQPVGQVDEDPARCRQTGSAVRFREACSKLLTVDDLICSLNSVPPTCDIPGAFGLKKLPEQRRREICPYQGRECKSAHQSLQHMDLG